MTEYDVIVVGAGNAALAAAVSARENGAECVVVLEKAPREMRGGNTHWSGGVLRFAFDDPREIGPLLPGVEDEIEDFYDGIQPYTFDDFHGDLMRVTSGQTDPVLSRILVQNSKDTVFWMNRVGNIRMAEVIGSRLTRSGSKNSTSESFEAGPAPPLEAWITMGDAVVPLGTACAPPFWRRAAICRRPGPAHRTDRGPQWH